MRRQLGGAALASRSVRSQAPTSIRQPLEAPRAALAKWDVYAPSRKTTRNRICSAKRQVLQRAAALQSMYAAVRVLVYHHETSELISISRSICCAAQTNPVAVEEAMRPASKSAFAQINAGLQGQLGEYGLSCCLCCQLPCVHL